MKSIIPNDTVILIAGVPGIGKTTVSHELLKVYSEIRMIQETDIIREILQGYNDFLIEQEKIILKNIYDHKTLLSYEMAKTQCNIMKFSIKNIVARQQRKGIPTIINGVHLIPEVLYSYLNFKNLMYILLYTESEDILLQHYLDRNDNKHPDKLSFLFDMNKELYNNTFMLLKHAPNVIFINVSKLSVKNTVSKIKDNIYNYFK